MVVLVVDGRRVVVSSMEDGGAVVEVTFLSPPPQAPTASGCEGHGGGDDGESGGAAGGAHGPKAIGPVRRNRGYSGISMPRSAAAASTGSPSTFFMRNRSRNISHLGASSLA